jgi:hypothetical protein
MPSTRTYQRSSVDIIATRSTPDEKMSSYQLNPGCPEKVVNPYGIWPTSPIIRQLTVPVGRIVKYVKEQLKVQSLSHASGGS